MEMLFVVLGSLLMGLGARYVLPGRTVIGLAILPAVSGAVSAVVWAALTWAGWRYDGAWIWVVTFALAGAAAVAAAFWLSRRRVAADERMLQTLSRV
jgi:hypothetical protein